MSITILLTEQKDGFHGYSDLRTLIGLMIGHGDPSCVRIF